MDTVFNYFENELLEEWTQDMMQSSDEYKEPLLDEYTVAIIKSACDTFKQDIHVFVMAIEIVEQYIRLKTAHNEHIKDHALILSASILLASKYAGEQVELKLSYIEEFLQKITGKRYKLKRIIQAEIEVYLMLDARLPISTKVDDLNTFIEKFVRDFRLRANIRKLALHLLELVYMQRMNWFFDLRQIYDQNDEALQVFNILIKSRFYLPVAILVGVLRMTNFQHFLNVDTILKDLTDCTKIHADHFNIMSNRICDIVNKCI